MFNLINLRCSTFLNNNLVTPWSSAENAPCTLKDILTFKLNQMIKFNNTGNLIVQKWSRNGECDFFQTNLLIYILKTLLNHNGDKNLPFQ